MHWNSLSCLITFFFLCFVSLLFVWSFANKSDLIWNNLNFVLFITKCSKKYVNIQLHKLTNSRTMTLFLKPKICVFKNILTKITHCEKKLARLLFDSGVVNKWTIPSHSVYNSCGLTPSRRGGRINSWTYFWNQNISQMGVWRRIWMRQLNHQRQFRYTLITICLSCLVFEIWQMTDGRQTDGRRTDISKQLISGL